VNGPAFTAKRLEPEPGQRVIVLEGKLVFAHAAEVWSEIRAHLTPTPKSLRVDLSKVERLDGGSAALVLELAAQARSAGAETSVTGAVGTVAEILSLYELERIEPLNSEPSSEPLLSQVGANTRGLVEELRLSLAFIGSLTRSIFLAIRSPSTVNWRGILPLAERAGADGLPIVLLIGFLVGFIMAFQGAIQLKQFGANIFVADLVGLTVTRELGPLMTAIVVAGRSGAAFAAELGTMKVSEEIDALRTLGLEPMRYLVIPRLLALVAVVPLLVLIADLMGLLGGLLVGLFSLDLTVTAYLKQTQGALALWDVGSGVLKSFAFAAAVSLIACQQGLATSGGAAGVGRRTTTAVVAILFALILIDAGFAVTFHVFES
jgi:phospholipid/cholesterol/gamma-HCH transport system permease protein